MRVAGRGSRVVLGTVALLILAASPTRRLAAAQQPRPAAQQPSSLQRAFDLERRGSYSQAAEAYRTVLRNDPADQSALLGLERSLAAIERVPEMVAEMRAGIAARPSAALYGMALRVWAAAGQPDSMRATAEQWAASETDKMVPFREWGDLLLQRRDLAGARRAYTLGRVSSGKPETLAAELALVSQLQGARSC